MKKRESCIYCGADKDLTVDHVPPKLLLMRPYPQNLITVPACRKCNQSFQKDDEYTRTMLAIDVRAAKNTAAESNLPAVLRSLQKPEARAFAEYLTRQAESSVILGEDGSPMGQVFELDKARTNRTGVRLSGHSTSTKRGPLCRVTPPSELGATWVSEKRMQILS